MDLASSRQAGDPEEICGHLVKLGLLLQGQQRCQEAPECYREALPLAEDSPWFSPVWLLFASSEAHQALGNLPEAIRCLTEALRRRQAVWGASPEDYCHLARLHLRAGNSWEGRELLLLAQVGFWTNGQVEAWEEVRQELRSPASRVARRGSGRGHGCFTRRSDC